MLSFCYGGVNAVAGTQGVRALSSVGPSRHACVTYVRALASVGRSLTQCRRNACLTSPVASAYVCVRACLPARAQLYRGRWWPVQHGEQPVSPRPHRGEACCSMFCAGSMASRLLRARVRCRRWVRRSEPRNSEHGDRRRSPGPVSESWAGESRSLLQRSNPSLAAPLRVVSLRTVMRQCRGATKTRPAGTTRS